MILMLCSTWLRDFFPVPVAFVFMQPQTWATALPLSTDLGERRVFSTLVLFCHWAEDIRHAFYKITHHYAPPLSLRPDWLLPFFCPHPFLVIIVMLRCFIVKNQDKLLAIRWLRSRLITDRRWWSMGVFCIPQSVERPCPCLFVCSFLLPAAPICSHDRQYSAIK